MTNNQTKLASLAELLDGRIVNDNQRVEVCIKGAVLGFPATLEAIRSSYPFGVTYFLETQIIEDPSAAAAMGPLKLVLTPRYARGILAVLGRILFFEARGQKLEITELDSRFICSTNDLDAARRFAQYPGIEDKLAKLYKYSNFSELLIKTDAGICLSQPTSFNALNADVFKEVFRLLGEIGQVIFDRFAH
jgi:hypothetical protein